MADPADKVSAATANANAVLFMVPSDIVGALIARFKMIVVGAPADLAGGLSWWPRIPQTPHLSFAK
jgi:hypothetical protein